MTSLILADLCMLALCLFPFLASVCGLILYCCDFGPCFAAEYWEIGLFWQFLAIGKYWEESVVTMPSAMDPAQGKDPTERARALTLNGLGGMANAKRAATPSGGTMLKGPRGFLTRTDRVLMLKNSRLTELLHRHSQIRVSLQRCLPRLLQSSFWSSSSALFSCP